MCQENSTSSCGLRLSWPWLCKTIPHSLGPLGKITQQFDCLFSLSSSSVSQPIIWHRLINNCFRKASQHQHLCTLLEKSILLDSFNDHHLCNMKKTVAWLILLFLYMTSSGSTWDWSVHVLLSYTSFSEVLDQHKPGSHFEATSS